jgi:integrase
MVYKRGQVWWIRFTFQGQQIRKSTGAANRQLALQIEAQVRHELEEGQWSLQPNRPQKTLRELLERYLQEHSFVSKRASSHRRDKSLVAHLLKAFGDQSLHTIGPAMIVGYKVQRRAEGAAPRTINLELSLMHHAWNKGQKEWEWVEDNPVAKVSRETINTSLERWLRDDEEERLLAVSPQWLREILIFALNTGLRQGEILDLQWPMVDLFRKTLTIAEQKNKAIDTLPLNHKALEVLKERANVRHRETPFVFGSWNGTKRIARNLMRAFYEACRKAKIEKFRFHDTRHTFASRLVQRGVDLYAVQKLGRWKSVVMVMRYAHHNSETLRPSVERLDEEGRNISTNLAQLPKSAVGGEC